MSSPDPLAARVQPAVALLALSGLLAASGAGAQAGDTALLPRQQPSASATASKAVPGSPASIGIAIEIQRINEQMALLQAQLNQLELQAKIAAKRKEIDSVAAAPATMASASAFDSRGSLPAVLSVAGLRGKLEAVLVLPGGLSQRVRTGDVIDDRRVGRISVNEVVLTDLQGKRPVRLSFGSAPHIREGTASQAAGSVLSASPALSAPGRSH